MAERTHSISVCASHLLCCPGSFVVSIQPCFSACNASQPAIRVPSDTRAALVSACSRCVCLRGDDQQTNDEQPTQRRSIRQTYSRPTHTHTHTVRERHHTHTPCIQHRMLELRKQPNKRRHTRRQKPHELFQLVTDRGIGEQSANVTQPECILAGCAWRLLKHQNRRLPFVQQQQQKATAVAVAATAHHPMVMSK